MGSSAVAVGGLVSLLRSLAAPSSVKCSVLSGLGRLLCRVGPHVCLHMHRAGVWGTGCGRHRESPCTSSLQETPALGLWHHVVGTHERETVPQCARQEEWGSEWQPLLGVFSVTGPPVGVPLSCYLTVYFVVDS